MVEGLSFGVVELNEVDCTGEENDVGDTSCCWRLEVFPPSQAFRVSDSMSISTN